MEIKLNRRDNQKFFKPTMADIGEILITHRHPSSYDSSHLLEIIRILKQSFLPINLGFSLK